MKKHILIFLSLFFIFLIPKNVFAESLVPAYASINNNYFVNTGNVIDRTLQYNLQCAANVCSFDIPTTIAYDGEEYTDFPYLLIYFKTNALPTDFVITRNATCNTSCFSTNIQFARLGRTTFNDLGAGTINGYLYAMVVPYNKIYFYDQWATWKVDDIFNFRALNGGWYSFQFVNMFVTKDTTILNTSFDTTESINNQGTFIRDIDTANTQNIINNNNTNTQNIINNQNQNTQNIINSITDDTPQTESESDSTLNRWKNLIPTNGVVSSLFLIPVNLIDKLVAGFNGTCQTFNLGNLLGTDLVLPCIQPANFFGSSLWGIIDLACCGMMLFSMFKKFVKVFSDITNLRDTPMNELYGGGR